ncbi:MAG: Hsp33 family molecular chaperone HslO, partial [Clostridia bacterium]|nr:Hsp33 family molecular chaperone HslO [Clostridia bacterium]
MADKLTIAVTRNGFIRIYAVNSKAIVENARKFHSTMPTGTAALGRLLTGAALMGAMLKDENTSLTLQMRGDGPLGRVIAV